MNSSTTESEIDVRAARVVVTERHVKVDLIDGRTIAVPLAWYPRLLHGTAADRAKVEIWDDGLYWPDLNADISFRAMLLGEKSGESPRSLKQWLERRSRGEKEQVPTRPLPPRLARMLKRKRTTRS